ncbi:hypothetical protein Rvan_2855 [Rhodomicrobium vannielii ATCC 17100]|uniref:Uncharacterized protein n=1 Tax=Rhodomicrobium vannielii (strain ATCC 17100 / DSM 162 / LMG 4299 / NCIMB 10020 / ATH 3.1.1) TaxID=648757 RepID=E3I8T3_RHOVT|nr:hypothetical protein [Rhodomicrobium vannielii]ADP72062.1 hypothetical protein Rvan_2855 [Rhodomicrobium vannielii ATCC 17100]
MTDILAKDVNSNSGQPPFAGDGKKPDEEKKRRGGIWFRILAVLLFLGALVEGAILYADRAAKNVEATPAPQPVVAAPQPVVVAPQPVAEKHAPKEKVENAYFFRIDGKDVEGRTASFDYIIVTNDYTWVKGSTTEVVANDTVIPEEETADRIITPKVKESFASALDLIAVGLASREGDREAEEARALARAQTVAGWISKVSDASIPLWTLTLGQYDRDACKAQQDADSSYERPVLLASVRARADGVNLTEAFADALTGHDNLPSRNCYSQFDLVKIR